MVLAYPDVYEIGMSHYGLQVLYHVLSKIRNVAVERVFAPWIDLDHYLRKRGQLLGTIESRRPLNEYDLIFITLPHDLAYTNVLNILDLGGVPIRRTQRIKGHPFVIGGGIGSLNPQPVREIFDAVFVGEAELSIATIISRIVEAGGRNASREMVHQALHAVPGVYVPSRRPVPGTSSAGKPVRKQFIADLDACPYPNPPLVPICRPTFERVVVEAARGCPHQCRFCQARVYFSPVRFRSQDAIQEIIRNCLPKTAYEEVSLLSLNIADYPDIEQLITKTSKNLRDRFTSVSLPSLRPEKLTPAIIEQIQSVRKSGFTLAPEAGTDRLRRIIGKPYDTDKLLRGVASVYAAGWSLVKLYFMIGQPFETDADIRGIVDLAREIRKIGRKIRGRKAELNISISIFIPKPHTPFQWAGQAPRDVLMDRIRFLRRSLRKPGIKLSIHKVQSSRLEAIFSRGDVRCGELLIKAYEKGCRFDAWNECFRPEIWQSVFSDADFDSEAFACREIPLDAQLPWSDIDTGIPVDKLKRSFLTASRLAAEPIEAGMRQKVEIPITAPAVQTFRSGRNALKSYNYIGFYQLKSDFVLFGHREITAALIRSARLAGLPLEYSYGYNPRPRFSFPQPAPLGFELHYEPFSFRLLSYLPPKEIMERWRNASAPDFTVVHLIHDPDNKINLQKQLRAAMYGFKVDPQILSRIVHPAAEYAFLTRDELLSGNRIYSAVPEALNLFLPCAAKGSETCRPGEVLKKIAGNAHYDYDEFSAARICWTVDSEGMHPFGLKNGE